MGRWEPDAAGRLRAAATDLFAERGYDEVTVADIADRAGLTSRTFFRYFADKREVLFGGSVVLRDLMVDAVRTAPADADPLSAVGLALTAAAGMLGGQRAFSRRRQALIESHPDLLERELVKLASLARDLAAELVGRGVDPTSAALAGETAMGVLRVGIARWGAGEGDDLAGVLRADLDRLRALAAA